jgi:hypothetical protein
MKHFGLFAALILTASLALGQSGERLPGFPGKILMTGQAPVNGTSEVDTITIGGTPSGGTFTLTFEGRTTSAITWSSTNATLVANIDAALEAVSSIGNGGVTTAVGSMTSGIGTITVTFAGNRAKQDVPDVAIGSNNMTGTSPTVAIATTTPGVTADGRISPKGTLLIDATNGKLYINTGAPLAPTWTVVGSQS